MNAVDNSAVELRGQQGDLFLYKLDVGANSVAFTPTTVSSSGAQGEQISAVEFAAAQPLGASVSNDDSTSRTLALSSSAVAQGEQIAAASSTVADVFVPATSDLLGSSDITVLPTDEAELWSREFGVEPQDDAEPAVDAAMQHVTSELSLVSDLENHASSDDGDDDQEAREAAVDSVLSSEI